METVLLPHDLSDFADRGFEALAELALPFHHVHIVCALPRIDLSYPGVVWPRDEDELRRKHALHVLRSRIEGTALSEAILHACVGDPGTQILELAREIGATLIVMPSHSRTGLKRMVRGSVAEHVSRFAPCPVLILPATAELSHELPPPDAPMPPEAQLAVVAGQLHAQVARSGGYLAAARIALPADQDPRWWADTLSQRLASAGAGYVDLAFDQATSPHAEILDCRFEPRRDG